MKLTCLAATILLFLANSASASDWTWRHPQPQGHTLNDIVFLDNTTAIAVGECGTILVTHDTGDTWSVRSKVLSVTSYTAIDRIDANTALVVGEFGLIARTTDQGATWTPVTVSGMHETMKDVSFFDALHGIAVGFQRAILTSDGGLTWQVASVSEALRSVDMTSPTNAVAVGDNNVLYTTNGGATWTFGTVPFVFPASAPLEEVDFLDPLHGAIAVSNGTDDGFGPGPARCYVTSDGGATWTGSLLDFGLTTREFHTGEVLYPQSGEVLVAGKICCFFGAYEPPPSGDFVSTVNSGGSWTHTGFGPPAYGLARNLDGVVIVVGENGRMLRRNLDATYTDFGFTLSVYQAAGQSSFFDSQVGVVFNSDGTNYMYGDATTFFSRTSDGGQTWATSTAAPTQCLDVVCLSATEIIAVGVHYSQGSVLRSTNGGATWPEIWTGAAPTQVHAVAAGSSTRAIAVGSGGTALIIDNGVVTPVATGGATFSDIAFATPSVVLAVGATDVRSIDGGLTWAPTAAPATGIRELDFVSATRAFGVDATGIQRTDNAGDSWTPVATGFGGGLRDISFADANHGMAVGDNALALMTVDGGATWVPSETPTIRGLNKVSMIAPDHAFISGLAQIVFEFGEQPVPTLIQSLNVLPRPFGADLRWEVATDENLAAFSIRRSSGAMATTVATGLSTSSRSFRDDGLSPGATYEYQLLAVDRDGSYTQSMPVRVTVPVARVELLPNQPNPFNPETTIRFVVPEKMTVQLTVHDVAGRVVATLVNDTRDPGNHTITWKAEGMASGVYFARLRAGKTEVSQKMVLLK